MSLDGNDLEGRGETENWYETAARLTRAGHDGESPRKFQTEQRILAPTPRRDVRVFIPWLLPGLAVLGGSVAWAAGGHVTLARLVDAIEELTSGGKLAAPDEPKQAVTAPSKKRVAQESAGAPSLSQPPLIASSAVSVEAAVPTQEVVAEAATLKLSKKPAPLEALPEPVPVNARVAGEDLSLYRAAHEAHFVRGDWQAALSAWDRYLAQPGVGRFLPEARFNRALALAKLGRTREARAALRVFATGGYGSYHQQEAQQLLGQLGGAD